MRTSGMSATPVALSHAGDCPTPLEQARIGLPQDGRAGMKLLAALRRDPPAASR